MNNLSVSKRLCILFVYCAAMAIATPAQTTATVPPAPTFTVVHSFDGTDGAYAQAGLLQGRDGNLYGTTQLGGANGDTGLVFKITTSGTETVLHNFCSQGGSNCTDGSMPTAGLIQGSDGKFYGTTSSGGANCIYCGTVFSITTGGALTTIYSFCSQTGCSDGAGGDAGLVQGADGKFYGTTYGGGAYGYGTVFSIATSGELTTLHSFDGTGGSASTAALVQGIDGNFYGTTTSGGPGTGNSCGIYGCGTVFKITPSGVLTTLHSFTGTDGAYSLAGLVQGMDGNFYGTTQKGGAGGSGTIFKITPSGMLTTLHGFCFRCKSGAYPDAGLVLGSDGNFYGTTTAGGDHDRGTVFEITPSGKLTRLYTFCQVRHCTDGRGPAGGLVQDTNGMFYGTTALGGAHGGGAVFSLSVGLGPFVKTPPASAASR